VHQRVVQQRRDDLGQAWLRDKKFRDGTRFIVLNGLGRPEAGVPANDATLAAVLDDLTGT